MAGLHPVCRYMSKVPSLSHYLFICFKTHSLSMIQHWSVQRVRASLRALRVICILFVGRAAAAISPLHHTGTPAARSVAPEDCQHVFLVDVPLVFFSWHFIPTAIVISCTSWAFIIQTKLIKAVVCLVFFLISEKAQVRYNLWVYIKTQKNVSEFLCWFRAWLYLLKKKSVHTHSSDLPSHHNLVTGPILINVRRLKVHRVFFFLFKKTFPECVLWVTFPNNMLCHLPHICHSQKKCFTPEWKWRNYWGCCAINGKLTVRPEIHHTEPKNTGKEKANSRIRLAESRLFQKTFNKKEKKKEKVGAA